MADARTHLLPERVQVRGLQQPAVRAVALPGVPVEGVEQVVEVVVGGDGRQVPLQLGQDEQLHRLKEGKDVVIQAAGRGWWKEAA